MDLFEQSRAAASAREAPLAARMRPRTLDEVVGQEHLLGPGRLLRQAIERDALTSVILYGPPGTG
ncbi:MAG: replication-associated recombination protein A, partial [Bacillati bacterium ANGP1]